MEKLSISDSPKKFPCTCEKAKDVKLNCGHNFCKGCVANFPRGTMIYKCDQKCPICQTAIVLSILQQIIFSRGQNTNK